MAFEEDQAFHGIGVVFVLIRLGIEQHFALSIPHESH